MANSVTARFNDDCKVFVSMSDDTTVEKAVIIDADGTETDIGGGSGESDFSMAEIQFIISGENVRYSTYILDSDKITTLNITQSITCTIPLYKGIAILPLPPGNLSEPASFSGDVQLSISDHGIKVTGDGTITMVSGSVH